MSSVKHQPPRQSASAMHRQDQCPSSYARELEYYQWAEEKGIAGIVSDKSANRGTDFHAILAKIPFSGRDFGAEPFDVRTAVIATAEKLGTPVKGYEAWVLTDMIHKRDEFIEAVIDSHPLGRSAVEDVELFLDERRVQVPIDKNGIPLAAVPKGAFGSADMISGLGDVFVIARAGGRACAGVLDYKSGQQAYDSTDNRQLDSLLALLNIEEKREGRPAIDVALAGIAAEIDQGQPLRLAKYTADDIARIEKWQLGIARKSTPLAWKMRASLYAPRAALDRELDVNAKVGTHCLQCRGKVCCGAIKLKGPQFEYAITQKFDYLLNESVKTETLSQTLALTTAIEQWAALYSKLREETEMLAIQLAEKGEKIEGAEIKPGRNRATLVSSDLKDLHAKLGPVLGGESIEQFAMAVVDNPKPTAVRQHIANKLGIPETKVIEQLGKALGADSPLVNKPERKSVEVTADLADIIQKVSKEISERHREGAIEATREASVSGADSSPAAAAAPKPVARRRAKKAEPEAPVAPAEIPVEPIAEDASEAVGQVQVGTKFM